MGDQSENDLNWFNISDFDGVIAHILQKIDIEARGDVISELANDADVDALQDVRAKLFVVCKKMYEGMLRETKAIEEGVEVDLTLQKRLKKADNTNLAKDIVDLFEFAIGGNEKFPKNVLARSSKYIDIQTPANKEDGTSKACNRDIVLARISNIEMVNTVKEQGKHIEALEKKGIEDRKKMEEVEKDLATLQRVVLQLQAFCDIVPTRDGNATTAQDGRRKSDEEAQQIQKDKELAQQLAETRDSTSDTVQAGGSAPAPSGPAKVHQESHASNNPSTGSAPWADAARKVGLQQRSSVAKIDTGNGNFAAVLYKQQPGVSNHQAKQQIANNINHISDGKQINLNSSMQQTQPQSPRGQTADPQKQSHLLSRNQPPASELLRGIKKEQGTFLYLENIEVDETMTYEKISSNIKAYAKSVGIRIMTIRVISNRYCEDVVGAKILIPESLEYKALDPDTWPSGIACRRWEEKPPRRKQYGNGYRGGQSYRNNRSRDWDEGEEYSEPRSGWYN